MDLPYILTLNLMVISALAIVSVLMQMPWRDNVLWLSVNALVIVAGLVGLQLMPDWAWLPAAAVFVPLVLGPVAAGIWSQRSAMQNRPERAAWFARVAAVLHPTARARFNAAVLKAQAAPELADRITALEALKRDATPAESAQLDVLARRLSDDWLGVVAHIRRLGQRSSGMAALEIRALGELDRIDEMARAYETSREQLIGGDVGDAQLFVLAFGGKPHAVEQILQRSRHWFSDDLRAYWTAIARRAAGLPETEWKPLLETLAQSSPVEAVRRRATVKLGEPVVPASTDLTPAGTRILESTLQRFERHQPEEARTGFLAAPVTYSILALLVAVHAVLSVKVGTAEPVSGDARYLRVLVDMGAMWPPYVWNRGEWWRLLTATFLHFGFLHLGANSLLLYMLGQPCEAAFGWWRMLIIYLVGGLASSTFVLALWRLDIGEPAVLVGASGAVMAVFGGLVGFRLLSWLRHRDVLDRRFLTLVPVILAIQFAVDLSTPQVSFAAHVSGFFAGLVLGTLLAMTQRRR